MPHPPNLYNIVPYNLCSHPRLAEGQIAGFTSLFKEFALKAAESLTAFCHLPISADLQKIEQIPFSRYLRSLQQMTYLAKFDSKPEKIDGFFEINAAIAYSIASKMLGGNGSIPDSSHTISSLEMAMNRKLINLLLSQFSMAWQKQAVESIFTIEEIFTSVRTARLFPPQELCLAASILMKVHRMQGLVTIAIPIRFLSPYFKQTNPSIPSPPSQKMAKTLQNLEVELVIRLGKNQLTGKEIQGLMPGDILVLDQKADQPVDILAENRVFCTAKPGLSGTHRSVILSI